MSNTKDFKKLKDYNWGLGIEHEMHIFHAPQLNNGPIKDFILFDSDSVVQRLLIAKQEGKLDISDDDYEFLKSVPFETSGRLCNNQWVIKKVPFKMPEFVTYEPFCSLRNKRDLLNMSLDIVELKNKFYKLLLLDKQTQRLVKKYGELVEYPYGMTRYLKCPIGKRGDFYIFEKKKDGSAVVRPEYNGSYHITFTLPHKETITTSEFIKIHQNFANQLQWLEPLMLTAYFSGDEYAPGTIKKRVRGSFRVMIIGWGNLAGSDVRLFKDGIGRYAKTETYWRKNMIFEDVDKLSPCYPPSPAALKEKAITSLSSDFRTFGSTDPDRPEHRESGIGMTVPNGIEFRIFDHFADKDIQNLSMFVSLVAENSHVTQTKGYVYKNKTWIKELHNIMQNGYKAKLSAAYINILRTKLGLKINTKSIIAFDVFKQIYDELYKKNINGEWSKIFNSLQQSYISRNSPRINIVPQINKKSWQLAFMVKANRKKGIITKYNKLSDYLSFVKKIDYMKFSTAIVDIFGKNWKNDVDDIAYFYETYKEVEIVKNQNGTIKSLKINNKIENINNFNIRIERCFNEPVLNIL